MYLLKVKGMKKLLSWGFAAALDKIFYVNPIDAVRKLKPTSVTIDSVGYVREDGWTPLGDHSPLSAVFGFVSL